KPPKGGFLHSSPPKPQCWTENPTQITNPEPKSPETTRHTARKSGPRIMTLLIVGAGLSGAVIARKSAEKIFILKERF
ncbi:hypothetical protein, partial [Paracoccus litorisediminis]|uniref:hypothetical protein n=1 Tax=Paracoccus litorisediminis TaxID=2006130 RepID=UPI001B8BA0C3